MFGSLNTETMTGKGIFLLYIFVLILIAYLWIKLLMKKREAEKGTVILIFVLAAAALASLIKELFASPVNRATVIETVILLVAFSVIGATELIIYLKTGKKEDSDQSEDESE